MIGQNLQLSLFVVPIYNLKFYTIHKSYNHAQTVCLVSVLESSPPASLFPQLACSLSSLSCSSSTLSPSLLAPEAVLLLSLSFYSFMLPRPCLWNAPPFLLTQNFSPIHTFSKCGQHNLKHLSQNNLGKASRILIFNKSLYKIFSGHVMISSILALC